MNREIGRIRIIEKIRGLDDGFPDTTANVNIAICWVERNGFIDCQEAWKACDRADWMFRYLYHYRREDLDSKIRLAACCCARTALRFVPESEDRPLRAIETAEAFAYGKATSAELDAARAAAKVVEEIALRRNKDWEWPRGHEFVDAARAAVDAASESGALINVADDAAGAAWAGLALYAPVTKRFIASKSKDNSLSEMADIIRLLIPNIKHDAKGELR